MSQTTQSLASAFPPPDREDWVALVEKTLKGAALDSIASRTADGIEVRPLHQGGAAAPLPSWRERHGEMAWDVRALTWHPDPARANADILDDLAGGGGSALVAVWDPAALPRMLQGVMTDV